MKYILMIDGHMAIVPSEDNERVIKYLKLTMLDTNRWILPMITLTPNHLTELSSITECGRVRFTTSADDYSFFRHFFNNVDAVLGGNK